MNGVRVGERYEDDETLEPIAPEAKTLALCSTVEVALYRIRPARRVPSESGLSTARLSVSG
jgi:hypothetical protein